MAEPGLNTTIVSNRRAGVTFKVYGAILTPGSRALPLLADPELVSLLPHARVRLTDKVKAVARV
jgi:hypothetical protein